MPISSLVSVIIPCYGQAQYLADALKSVLNQSYSQWECIIVNDGSLDNTRQVAEDWVKRDHRFIYVEKKNGGLASARNAGLDVSRGDYIQFLDADDLILPEKLKHQVSQLELISDLVFSISDFYCCDINEVENRLDWHMPTQFVTEDPLKELLTRWELDLCIPAHCFLFDARIFKENKITFDERLYNHEDWDCWMQILSINPQIQYFNEPMAVYRISKNSMSRNRIKMRDGFLKALKKQRNLLIDELELVQLIDDKINEVKKSYKNVSSESRFWNSILRVILPIIPIRYKIYFE